MTKTIAEKMGLKQGTRTWFSSAPDGLTDIIGATGLEVSDDLNGEFGYLHLFAKSQRELEVEFARLKPHLAEGGSLWLSWPKGGQLGTDLNLHEVIRIGYARGLVESTCLSIDTTWSALKFTHPKPGKTYTNSHAELVRD